MTTVEFITALFSEVDEQLRAIPQHPEAHLWPSEVGTLGKPGQDILARMVKKLRLHRI